MEDPEFQDYDEFDDEVLEMMTLEEALRKAEEQAGTTRERPDLDYALELALMEAVAPAVKETWRGIDDEKDDMLSSSRKLAALTMLDCDQDCDWVPQAIGHALVEACRHGLLLVVRRLREIQRDRQSGSLMVALFNAFGLLKAAEAGHEAVVREILKPMVSASTALMGFIIASKWKETGYPFVTPNSSPPNTSWTTKLSNSKSNLPAAGPVFQAGWELRGFAPGMHESLHEVVRASYQTYLVWRVGAIVAIHSHIDVFRVLLQKRFIDNLFLKEALSAIVGKNVANGTHDVQAKRLVADRAKMDTAMYQLVEECSTKNYSDAMLYTLWKFCVSQETGKDVGKPKCVAEAHDGMWEIKLEVPLLMMQVDHAHKDEEPKDRYKHLTMLYPQTARLNIQLQQTVLAQTDFVQVELKIKHVRLKAENSRWDESCMGHFPTGVTVTILPLSDEGSSVTLTNSSQNEGFSVSRGENISLSTGLKSAASGPGVGLGASGGRNTGVRMKSTPWRFEQVPLPDNDRGGSFKWTLQSMKSIPFDRTNPIRMAESTSMFKWGRRVPSNPLDTLPFTSEGGVQFTVTEFGDAMVWRFPRDLESKTLRWKIQGQIHTTYNTSRYFETRSAIFTGEIEDEVKAASDEKDPNKNAKSKKDVKSSKDVKSVKDEEDGSSKKDAKLPMLEKFNTMQRNQFVEWMEFKKALEEMKTPKTVDTIVEDSFSSSRFDEGREEVFGSQIVEAEDVVEAVPSLARLSASTKGKSWFRR